MKRDFSSVAPAALLALIACAGCGGGDDTGSEAAGGTKNSAGSESTAGSAPGGGSSNDGGTRSSGGSGTPTDPDDGPPPGNPDGHAEIPTEGQLEDVSEPTTVIGDGTPESCTAQKFVDAVAEGGTITFDCGRDPLTLTLSEPAKVFNDTGEKLIIDGGGLITLSGGGKSRILYMATCNEEQVYPPGPGDCNSNPGVQLVVQNLTFVDGSAVGLADDDNHGGGGAIYAQGGRLKVVNCRFFNNVCDPLGSDVGGGAIRKLDYLPEAGAGPARPVWVVNSTFGGAEQLGNSCANGGALSSIGVSWNIINSYFSHDTAVGHGANDGDGGNGGAIYNDGNEIVLQLQGSLLEDNLANEGGSAVFFVSNNKTGSIKLEGSVTRRNPRGTFETPDYPGFFIIAKGPPEVIDSSIER